MSNANQNGVGFALHYIENRNPILTPVIDYASTVFCSSSIVYIIFFGNENRNSIEVMLKLFKKNTISQVRYGGQFVSAAIHTSAALSYHRKDHSKVPNGQGESSIDVDDPVAR